ncbi:ATP-binding cassette domain-containing protein [Paenibacillus physcomitrellae]|uniref:Energy-coupling factor transporter ATP-binding protein EcfA2 n=1 Tax=Paenibacillus physcomitrellae TaxID=1619311 RepID=A0ABQ1FV64_9BACL|nr:ATP-binding cassette domain-containing protein [Paenibacillus physcomitrellae]GGA31712.1 energy-coupling factor transporter ATP-binding protein EcfA2 [Paenibacillus physcomitrellae]
MPVIFENVSYAYDDRTLFRQQALSSVSLRIKDGSFTAVAGPTGCGKSTLLQMFGGLLEPSEGKVTVFDNVLQAGVKTPKLKEMRRRVGLVFQFPEHQLFEETVEKDLCFAPLNFGLPIEEAKRRAAAALRQIGLPEELLAWSPFELSGGQMRKAAIASVLVMDPDILVLDEPGASLDPSSRAELIELLLRLCREQGKTVVMVTHRMDELLPYADRWILMKEGSSLFQGTAAEMVRKLPVLEAEGLELPECMHWWHRLDEHFDLRNEQPVFTAAALAELTARLLKPDGQKQEKADVETAKCGNPIPIEISGGAGG